MAQGFGGSNKKRLQRDIDSMEKKSGIHGNDSKLSVFRTQRLGLEHVCVCLCLPVFVYVCVCRYRMIYIICIYIYMIIIEIYIYTYDICIYIYIYSYIISIIQTYYVYTWCSRMFCGQHLAPCRRFLYCQVIGCAIPLSGFKIGSII